MRKNPRQAGPAQPEADEIAGLERALDRAYTRLRERARMDWERFQGTKADPTSAIVSVRVTAEKTPLAGSTEQSPLLLVRKSHSPRNKASRKKRGR